jgi:hypothetical protein
VADVEAPRAASAAEVVELGAKRASWLTVSFKCSSSLASESMAA